MLFRGAPQPYSCNCARMSLLSPLGLPKISATIAVGNFFVGRSAFSRYRLIPKLTFTRLQSLSTSRLYYGMAQTESEYFTFGPYKINPSEVFYSTVLSRVVKRFVDLTANETTDLWLVAKEVGDKLERHHKASSLTFAIQDGPQAGQTVPHVHIHIIPRRIGDFEKNDEIYEAIDMKEKHLKDKLDLDISREDRTYDEMAREADEYRVLFS